MTICNLEAKAIVIGIIVLMQYGALAQVPECTGVECVKVISVKYGTRCGNKPNSVSVDIQNTSGTMYMMGYAVFATSTGPIRSPTGYVAPGATMNLYSCDATTAPKFEVNTGPKDTVRAPMYWSDNASAANPNHETTEAAGPDEGSCKIGEKMAAFSDGLHRLPGVSIEEKAEADGQACPAVNMGGVTIDQLAVTATTTSYTAFVNGGIVKQCQSQVKTTFVKCVSHKEQNNYPKKRFQIDTHSPDSVGRRG